MAEHQKLLRDAAAESSAANEVLAAPNWGSLPGVAGHAAFLNALGSSNDVAVLAGAKDLGEAMAAILKLQDTKPGVYLLCTFVDIVRTDTAGYEPFMAAFKNKKLFPLLTSFLMNPGLEARGANAASYFLTGLMWQAGKADDGELSTVITNLMNSKYPVDEVGLLDALTNLLKHPEIRAATLKDAGVQSKLMAFSPDSPVPVVYKCVFAVWMWSCDPALAGHLKTNGAVAKLKQVLASTRTEKIVRVGLMAIKNLVGDAETQGSVVEAGCLEAVEALEYEKWRDSEVYDSIKSVANSLATAQKKHSNFARYEAELDRKALSWGFVHGEKFWNENYLQFEKDEFRAVKKLVDILSTSKDSTTLAVACHDLGEFARLHPAGKMVLTKMPRAKAKAMECMANDDREVAREALLCVQKMMLNRWQDCAAGAAP